jgi:hypothetical protein
MACQAPILGGICPKVYSKYCPPMVPILVKDSNYNSPWHGSDTSSGAADTRSRCHAGTVIAAREKQHMLCAVYHLTLTK